MPGQFLLKDVVLLGAALLTAGEAWAGGRRFGPAHETPNPYERCQASFGRFIVDYIRWFLGCWQAFLTAPLPVGKAKRGGAVGKVCRVCENWSLERALVAFDLVRGPVTVLSGSWFDTQFGCSSLPTAYHDLSFC